MEQLGRHVNAAFLSEYVVSNERLFSHVNAACFFSVNVVSMGLFCRHTNTALLFQ